MTVESQSKLDKALGAVEDLLHIPAEFGKSERETKVSNCLTIMETFKSFLETVREVVEEKRDNVEERQPDSDLHNSLSEEFDGLESICDTLDEIDYEFGGY